MHNPSDLQIHRDRRSQNIDHGYQKYIVELHAQSLCAFVFKEK
jgi:hypothetical protein